MLKVFNDDLYIDLMTDLSFTSEVLRLGYQFEETYPSLFAEITKQLKVSFLDRRVLAQLMKDFSKGMWHAMCSIRC